MDRILNIIKCSICQEILESPVILPCNHTVCKKHVTSQIKDDHFNCDKCGVEHGVPTNGFQLLPFLEELIKIGIADFDYGSVHNKAKKSCESFEELLKEIEIALKNPFFLAHERISELKNSVQLKGEELKLVIDQEMKELIDRLDECERQSKEYLSSNQFKKESEKLAIKLKSAHSNLDSWLTCLNKLKVDQEKWENIIKETNKEIKNINNEFDNFKNKLLSNKFDENQKHVNLFKSIKIDSILENLKKINNNYCDDEIEYLIVNINRNFLVSRIINQDLNEKLETLLQNKNLNKKKWSLLYQGSRDGFRASDFHSCCDGKPNTLTIVKTSNGNIFGGYTIIPWQSTKYDDYNGYTYDKSAFLFSLVNLENRQLIFEHTNESHSIKEDDTRGSVWSSSTHGPIFGGGHDLCISDRSYSDNKCFSNLGYTYIHEDYKQNSERAALILSGSRYFKVNEIEVFQIKE